MSLTREQLKKHWEVIEAFKEGGTVQKLDTVEGWYTVATPRWHVDGEYRIKPSTTVRYYNMYNDGAVSVAYSELSSAREAAASGVREVVKIESDKRGPLVYSCVHRYSGAYRGELR